MRRRIIKYMGWNLGSNKVVGRGRDGRISGDFTNMDAMSSGVKRGPISNKLGRRGVSEIIRTLEKEEVERASVAIRQAEGRVRVGRRVVKFVEDIFEDRGTLCISLVEVSANKPKIMGPASVAL